MKILATKGDVKTRSSEDANRILRSSFTFLDLKRHFMGSNRMPFVSQFYGSLESFISNNFQSAQNHRSNNYCFIKVHTSRGKHQLLYLIYFF